VIATLGLVLSSVRTTARESVSRSYLVRLHPSQPLKGADEEVHAGRRFGGGFFKERTADLIVTVGAHVEAVPTESRTKMRGGGVNNWSPL